MKQCTGCKEIKGLEEFAKKVKGRLGRQATCKKCQNEYHRQRYASNKEYRENRLNAARLRSKSRHVHVYGISDEKFEELKNKFSGLCHICKTQEWTTIDHDHSCCNSDRSCGRCVRGLLCTGCNVGLGMFRDSAGTLKNALEYLGN